MTETSHEIVIVGAGFAGIGMAIALKKHGFHAFTILESADDVGGTWRDNTYPGVAVDIPSLTYSFSFAQRSDWSRLFAPGRELKRYADDCVATYDLARHMRFRSRVRAIRFDEQSGRWRLSLADGGELTARYVISATGLLTQPKYPDIEGLASFAGEVVHSARWPDTLDLRNKRVAVIGTGATSVQLVPAIADSAAHVTVFQRTPIWILPKLDARVPDYVQTLFRVTPGLQSVARLLTSAGTELVMVLAIVYNKQFPLLVRGIERLCRAHLRAQVKDRALRRKLTPSYGFGCKRPSFSNEYLASFNRSNVSLETERVRAVEATGIVMEDGRKLAFDTLLLATGFQAYERGNLPTYEVYGRANLELSEFWSTHRYQAYQGATVPQFPNFFMMVGPYAATGSSWFAMVENQAAHITRCLTHGQALNASRIEVTEEAHARFFRFVQARQKNTVFFNNQCGSSNSFYFDKHGDALFYRPASGIETHYQSRHFPLSDYSFT